jgi:hypothetical protein
MSDALCVPTQAMSDALRTSPLKQMRVYQYVGPKDIAQRVAGAPKGALILSAADITRWICQTHQEPDADGIFIATFVIDDDGSLRISDRRSEHVACAGGKPVRSAGEIAFELTGKRLRIAAITNQSTGYCPEPQSWEAVATAVNAAKLDYQGPDRFEPAFEFRRCLSCASINLIKNKVFQCSICNARLPICWNFS